MTHRSIDTTLRPPRFSGSAAEPRLTCTHRAGRRYGILAGFFAVLGLLTLGGSTAAYARSGHGNHSNPHSTNQPKPPANPTDPHSPNPPQPNTLKVRWGPVLGPIAPDAAAFRFRLTRTASCTFLLNGAPAGKMESDGSFVRVTAEGLTPGTTYTYGLEFVDRGKTVRTKDYSFSTPPKNPGKWRFAVFGDTRTNPTPHAAVVEGLLKSNPAPIFVLHSGDLVESGLQDAHWDSFFGIESKLLSTIPFLPSMGNHERAAPTFFSMFANPLSSPNAPIGWYSFRYANAVFVVLNSESDPTPQTAFLEQEFAKAEADGIPWRFAMWHQPPYSSGSHGGNDMFASKWVPIMEKYHAACGFYGHDHIYEHSLKGGVHHVVAGGGGAPLYTPSRKPNPYTVKAMSKYHHLTLDVASLQVKVTVWSPEGTVLDEFTIMR